MLEVPQATHWVSGGRPPWVPALVPCAEDTDRGNRAHLPFRAVAKGGLPRSRATKPLEIRSTEPGHFVFFGDTAISNRSHSVRELHGSCTNAGVWSHFHAARGEVQQLDRRTPERRLRSVAYSRFGGPKRKSRISSQGHRCATASRTARDLQSEAFALALGLKMCTTSPFPSISTSLAMRLARVSGLTAVCTRHSTA